MIAPYHKAEKLGMPVSIPESETGKAVIIYMFYFFVTC